MAVPVLPPRGPRPSGRLSGAERLTLIARAQLALTVLGVVSTVAGIYVLAYVGNGMACFDGDQQACAADPVGLSDLWLPLVAGATLVVMAVVVVLVTRRHRRGRARRVTAVTALSLSAALNGLAALAYMTL